jgi:hypothetical protein
MNEFKVEYLVILKDQGSFCNSVKSFNNLLKANDDIEIKSNRLKYKKLDLKFENKTGTVADKKQRFFNLTFTLSQPNLLEEYIDFLKVLREIIYKSGGNVNTIWDDISYHFSLLSYPVVNKIENLLRQLITKFMLTSVGFDWEQETLPDDIKSVVSKSKRPKNGYVNILHETDFIHLADFLFKPYHRQNVDELFKSIKKSKTIEDLDFDKLKEYIPKSNWDRYFSDIVDCEDGFLNKKWSRLYELRCLVAHNNFITPKDYNELTEISKSLEDTFLEAIQNLDKIRIDSEDKDILIESVIRNRNEFYGEFLNNWKILEHEILQLLHSVKGHNDKTVRYRSTMKQLMTIMEADLIDKETFNRIRFLSNFRNSIVHEPNSEIHEKEIVEILNVLRYTITSLRDIRAKE